MVAGYIHDEGKGVRAIDQRGGAKGKLRQTRLYVYPDVDAKVLHQIITIGDKSSQREDIKLSADFVVQLKEA